MRKPELGTLAVVVWTSSFSLRPFPPLHVEELQPPTARGARVTREDGGDQIIPLRVHVAERRGRILGFPLAPLADQ